MPTRINYVVPVRRQPVRSPIPAKGVIANDVNVLGVKVSAQPDERHTGH